MGCVSRGLYLPKRRSEKHRLTQAGSLCRAVVERTTEQLCEETEQVAALGEHGLISPASNREASDEQVCRRLRTRRETRRADAAVDSPGRDNGCVVLSVSCRIMLCKAHFLAFA